ncbi:MAG: hypothetical protein WC919_00910 [Candidatus Paceibacterota bacterium]|jgi:hypothetical protein
MAMTENDKIQKYGPVVFRFASRSSGEEYLIRLKEGIHHCNCKGFIFSKEVPKSCKHIKAYFVENGKTQKVAELTDVQIVEKCLRTAGCYDPIKASCESSQAFQHKLLRLAQAFTPYFGGTGPALDTTALPEVGVIRTIYLD